jgi:hypothetical protein
MSFALIIHVKGTVQRKLRWVKSGHTQQFFVYCLGAYIYIYLFLKGHLPLKSIKLVSTCQDYKNKLDESNQRLLKKKLLLGL